MATVTLQQTLRPDSVQAHAPLSKTSRAASSTLWSRRWNVGESIITTDGRPVALLVAASEADAASSARRSDPDRLPPPVPVPRRKDDDSVDAAADDAVDATERRAEDDASDGVRDASTDAEDVAEEDATAPAAEEDGRGIDLAIAAPTSSTTASALGATVGVVRSMAARMRCANAPAGVTAPSTSTASAAAATACT